MALNKIECEVRKLECIPPEAVELECWGAGVVVRLAMSLAAYRTRPIHVGETFLLTLEPKPTQ